MNIKRAIEGNKYTEFRHLLTETILTISILAATAVIALVAVSKGRLETADSNVTSGWVYNSDSPDHALDVLITITNKNTGEEVFSRRMSAGEYREDFHKDNKGNGCHGFTINTDWDAYPEGVYLVEGAVDDRSSSNPRTYANRNSQTGTSAPGSQASTPLGVLKTTAYCPHKARFEGRGRHICTGAIAMAGHTIAADPRVIPYGSKVMINGVVHTAEDRGGVVKGNHIDVFFNIHAEIRQHDTQNAEVYLVQS